MILRRASTHRLMMTLSSIREQLFHHFKACVNVVFHDDII